MEVDIVENLWLHDSLLAPVSHPWMIFVDKPFDMILP
jgi:hypothetical protein